MIISSIDNEKIKNIRKLNDGKYSKEQKKFIIETENLIMEAIKENKIDCVLKLDSNENSYTKNDIIVTDNVMKTITKLNTIPKVIGVCNYLDEKESIGRKVLVLDKVQDPGNLGTLIRSAVAFNFDTIVLSDTSVSLYNDKVIRSTEGMMFKINIIRRNVIDFLKDVKEHYKVYGTNVRDGIDVKEVNKDENIILILGNEGNGMSPEVEELCDKNIYIKTLT